MISARAKRLRIAIYPDNRVVVTQPRDMPQKQVESFVRAKQSWIENKLQAVQQIASPDLRTTDHMHFLLNRSVARKFVKTKLEQWNAIYQFDYGFFSIKKMRTRWGSCSANGNMSFNYKLLFLSEELQDLVIVHELCHLKVRNHGKDFWKLVSLAKPQFIALNEELRKL
jgi:hypothetical protein